MRYFLKVALMAVAIFFLVGFVVMLIFMPHRRDLFSSSYWRNLLHAGEVMQLVNEYHVDPEHTDYDSLTRNALKEMVGSLDNYSGYMDNSDYEEFEIHTEQHYAGIGAEVGLLDSRVTVLGIFPNSPAEEAGLLVGDEIVAVGDTDTSRYSVQQTVDLLRGEPGSEATMTVYRPMEGEEVTFTLKRREIDYPSLREVYLDEDGIGYLKLASFGRESGDELEAAINHLNAQGMRALVLDLRGNPGGLLSQAIDVADLFVDRGKLIVTTRDRSGNTREEAYAMHPPVAAPPMVILIDHSSASASEIVAGALQDHGRAVIVGENSVGKGSVQSVYSFSNGDGMRLTSAMYYLPSGRTIHEKGVEPDITVSLPTSERMNLSLQRSQLRVIDSATFRARYGFDPIPDRQLDRAWDILLGVLSYQVNHDN